MVIDDEMWIRLKALLPKPKGRHGGNDRMFMEALCWIMRTGAPWRDLPVEYGPWQTTYNRYNRWIKKGHLNEIFRVLKKRWVPRSGVGDG